MRLVTFGSALIERLMTHAQDASGEVAHKTSIRAVSTALAITSQQAPL